MARLASSRQPAGQELHWKQRAGVSVQGLVADAQRLGALAQELAVSAHPLGVDGAHVEHLLGRLRSRRPARSPIRSRARSAQPASTVLRGPEAGARVDHRRPADGAADRRRDRRAALGDRQPAVAVERRQRRQGLVGIAAPVHVGAGLEHDDLEAGLGEDRRGDRAAGARADDRHVALLAAGGRAQVTEARAGLRSEPGDAIGDLAAHLVADRLPHPRVVAVAETREDLEEQQQVAGERGMLEPSRRRRKSWRASRLARLNRHGKGSHSRTRSASLHLPHAAPAACSPGSD